MCSCPQATFLEYGFCETLDALKNVDEAQKKLVGVQPRLDQIQRMLDDPEADLNLVIAELRDVIAHLNGILQVCHSVTQRSSIADLLTEVTTTINTQRLFPTMNYVRAFCVFIQNIGLNDAPTILLVCSCKLLS